MGQIYHSRWRKCAELAGAGKYFSWANQSAERRDRLYNVFTLKLMCVMADNQISDLHSTLKELVSELQGQKREISSLKEVRGNSVTVSTEVKNLTLRKRLTGDSWAICCSSSLILK